MTQMRILACLICLTCSGCSAHLFSGVRDIDRTRPIALIDVRDQASKLGATTEEGIVFLDQEGAKGPCRVHYFLAGDLLVEDGTIEPLGGVFSRARIDLKTQAVPVLRRELTENDQLLALLLVGHSVERLHVSLTRHPAVKGYALDWPGRDLPRGTAIFTYGTGRSSGDLIFVGLASGMATLNSGGAKTRFITFAGPARMREALTHAKLMFRKHEIKHRPDGITISR